MKTYTVYYWTGGREVGKWNLCVPVSDKAAAHKLLLECAHAGYVSHFAETSNLQAIGLPDGPPPDAHFRSLGL